MGFAFASLGFCGRRRSTQASALLRHARILTIRDKTTRRANHFCLSEDGVKPRQKKYFCFPEMKIRLYK
jgi:hypothetical protein